MQNITLDDLEKNFNQILDFLIDDEEDFIIENNEGEVKAMLIPISHYQAMEEDLQRLNDLLD